MHNFFKNIYKGRVSATQFLKGEITLILFLIGIIILVSRINTEGSVDILIVVLSFLLSIILHLSLFVRRQHDLGRKGRNSLLLLSGPLSFLGSLGNGVEGENEYGGPPTKRNVFKVLFNIE